MPLPIALGGKSVSAQSLPGPCCHPVWREDGMQLEPVELYQALSWAVCPQNEWLVRVTASYYDLVDVNASGQTYSSRDCTMVEVRIQISPLTRPLSPNYRETSHHLKLVDGAEDSYPQSQPQVVVSEDRRNLAILLFHPHQQSSAVVIFQLRRPRSDLQLDDPSSSSNNNNQTHHTPIPLPSYCLKVGNDANAASVFSRDAPAVATHPRFVSVWGISTICSIPNVTPPVLLAACQDGSCVWLDARSSLAVATGTLNIDDDSYLPLSSMTAAPTSDMEHGRLLAVGHNGNVFLAKWDVVKTTSVQQTFLRRASTGTVVVQSKSFETPKPSQVLLSPSNNRQTKSGPEDALQRTLNSLLSPKQMMAISPIFQRTTDGKKSKPLFSDLKLPFGGNNKERAAQEEALRKQHMDQFVLKELQSKKTMIHQQQELAASRRFRQRRRQSNVGGGGMDAGHQNALKRNIQLEVLSLLVDDEDAKVVDARFACMSTIVCVAYKNDNDNSKGHPMSSNNDKRIAQVFSISETGNFQPLTSLSLTKEQIEQQAASVQHNMGTSTRDVNSNMGPETMAGCSIQSRLGLDHDPSSDTFAISSVVGNNRWIGCLWNWRQHVLGWMVQNPAQNELLWSRLYFAKHPKQGSHLVYLESSFDESPRKYLQTRKQVVATGLLSPPSSFTTALEPSSLLLARGSICFPDAAKIQQTVSDVAELEWKVSALPLTYLNAYGPPQIAAVGRQHGSSMAVASSCGVCILDNKYKWKQFGSPNEEKTFQVIAMAWWEGQGETGPEEEFDDLLVAIIQSNNGRQYLSSWSPKRLDLAHQLLEPADAKPRHTDETVTSQFSWGIPLTKDIKATSLSILGEPRTDASAGSRRAIVLVSAANMETCEMSYASYHLQIRRHETSDAHPIEYSEQKPYCVLVKPSVQGTLKNGARSIGPISSVFLAGASFQFDLDNTCDAKEGESEGKFVATVGVVRTPGGLEAISLSSTGKAWVSSVVDADEVSKFWLTDIVCTSNLLPKTVGSIDAYVWAVQMLNGELFCWSVPFLLPGISEPNEKHLSAFLTEAKIARPKGLYPPTLVCKKSTREATRRFYSGALCHIGSSSDWMQQTSSGCQADIAMGQVPESMFGCVLRAGQTSRKLHRTVVGDFDTELFASDFLESDVYGPSEFLMTPPSFVPSLYAMFLEAAYLRTEIPVMEESKLGATSELLADDNTRLATIEKHILFRLQSSPNKDAVVMALRLLILRSVEMLTSVDRKHKKEQSDVSRSALLLASALFSEIVDTVRKCTSNLQFASLFLEVGRQIEPSCLPQLFPLPLSGNVFKLSQTPKLSSLDDSDLDRSNARSVVELFLLCIHENSLAASASALPLLGSRRQSRNYCDLLLVRSITAFVNNTDSTEAKFDFTHEQRRVIGDIFRYGIKLEDAARLEALHEAGESKEDTGAVYSFLEDNDDASGLRSSESADSADLIRRSTRGLMCVPGRQSSILSYIAPSMFPDNDEEDAIRRAAASFIDNNVDLPMLDFLTLSEKDEAEVEDGSISNPDPDLKSVGGLVGDVVLELLRSPKVDHPWKTMSCLARLLLQGEKVSTESDDAFVHAAEGAQPDDIEKIVPMGYEGDHMERLTRFIVVEIGRCGYQINGLEAGLIVDLALLLLKRLKDFPLASEDQSVLTCGLALVVLVAGHVSARTSSLLSDIDLSCLLVKGFQRAKSDSADSV